MATMAESQTTPTGFSQDLFCQDCGYNLRGLTGDRCPECGRSLAGLRSDVSQIPWVHRKKIGRFRAYWKTVWFVMFRQRQFCDEMVRPVSFVDSQLFRWWTIGIAFLPCILAAGFCDVLNTQSPTHNEVFLIFWTTRYALFLHFGAILFLIAATGIPSYFFESPTVDVTLRNRAIALSYYACSPLSLLVLPVLTTVSFLNMKETNIQLFFMLCSGLFPLALLAIWWLDLIHLSLRLMPENHRRANLLGLFVPLLWVFAFFITVFLVPLIALYIVIIMRSVL